ncbi:MAG: glycosyltransferase [Chloroflexota bacterium]
MVNFFLGAVLFSGMIFAILLSHLIRLRLIKIYPPTQEFSVAVIVPCKGNDDPNFGENLSSIVCQEYQGQVQFVFCVESELDSAFPVLQQLKQRFPHIQICVAGLATASAQKTFNILKSMELAGEVDLFLFADADIEPHRTWLQEMVAPFVEPHTGVVSGIFRRVPVNRGVSLGNYLAGVFGAYIVAGMSDDRLKAVWGGSLAIRRSVIEGLHLRERLATEIVDDIVIMDALRQHKVERRYVPSCTLKSYCDMSTPDSIEWLARQMQFSQVYLKGLYTLFCCFCLPYALYILATPFAFTYGVARADWELVKTITVFLLSVMLVGALLRLGVPVNRESVLPDEPRYRLLPWMLITPIAFVAVAQALLKTRWRIKRGVLTMYWRKVEYRVDVKTGKVLEIIRQAG